jgi:hypothetical protein
MSFSAYSLTPSANLSINGISIAENCPAENVNDALRQLAADGRELYNTVNAISVSSYMPKSGGAFTGTVTRLGGGAFTYYASSSLTGGAEYVQTTATALPSSPAEGTKVFQY